MMENAYFFDLSWGFSHKITSTYSIHLLFDANIYLIDVSDTMRVRTASVRHVLGVYGANLFM